MAEQRIEIGQVWVSRNRRDNGREARVVSVVPVRPEAVEFTGGGYALLQGTVRRTIRFKTLRRRYRLKTEALTDVAD